MPVVRLAIIGCGAATELCHLPAAKLTREVEIVALVDKNIARVKFLGERFGIACCAEDYYRLPENVDRVIVALPNYLHAPVSIEFLNLVYPYLSRSPWRSP